MKVKGYEVFKCDAGWRTFSFLKLVTDDGIIGWSEYNESFGSPGLSGVIEALMPTFDQGMVAIVVDGDRFLGLVTRIDVLNFLRRKL